MAFLLVDVGLSGSGITPESIPVGSEQDRRHAVRRAARPSGGPAGAGPWSESANGLGHRILWQYDVDADSSLEAEERLYLCYDERWRTVATYWDDDTDPKEQFVHHAAGQRGFAGSSYIDSVVLRDRDDTSGWASAVILAGPRRSCVAYAALGL